MYKFLNRVLLLSVFLFSCALWAQETKHIDSLRNLLKDKSITDSKKARVLAALGWFVSYSDENEGLKYAEEAIAISGRIHDIPTLAHANQVAGTIYIDLGNYPMAMECLQKTMKLYDSIKEPRGVAIAAGNMGNVYTRRGEYRKALQSFFKGFHFFLKDKNHSFASSCMNIGGSYNQLGMPDSALYYYDMILAIPNIDSLEIFTLYDNIASVYLAKKDYKSAKEFLIKSTFFLRDTSRHYYYADHYMTLGSVEAGLKNYPAALTATLLSLSYNKTIGVMDNVKTCYKQLSEIYELQGNLVKSLEYYKQFSNVKDSLQDQENERQVKFMEARFGADQKEKDIELLKKNERLQEEELHRKNTLLYAFVFGGIIMILAFVVSVYAFVNKRKANRKLVSLNNEIHKQKNQLLEKNQAITDSIHYARRIQTAMLTSGDYIKKHVPDFFILNIPKDIVSGDFYWAYHQDNKLFFMCADCTGHGVPGAFMSLLGINFLNEIIIEKKICSPDQVLNELRADIIQALNKEGNEETKDGMDCALSVIDMSTLEIRLAAANNPVWIIRPPVTPMQTDENGALKLAPGFKFTDCKPDKMPVGKSPRDEISFSLKNYQLKKGDCVYLFSDGFADQFGGPKGKKYKYKQLKELLFKNCHLPMTEQKTAMQNSFAEWKSKFEQVDDVLVIGIKV